jgi:hypothetical protein
LGAIDKTGLTLQTGSFVLPANHVQFIKDIDFQLNRANIEVDHVLFPPRPNELLVYPKGVGYYVKYNMVADAREQAGRHIALSRYMHRQNKKPNVYIDVRVPERAYVR